MVTNYLLFVDEVDGHTSISKNVNIGGGKLEY